VDKYRVIQVLRDPNLLSQALNEAGAEGYWLQGGILDTGTHFVAVMVLEEQ
jgi:hypothetical protein